ncbi:MAG: hypothetical protein KKI08_05805 [Armatimonadetes bacterium]|nr:hypothetical protein [Armatimonadota bacterium]
MTDRYERDMRETIEFISDPLTRAELLEAGPQHLLVAFDCLGAVQRRDGTIEIVPRHVVRFVGAEKLHGLMPIYEPQDDERFFHPNARPGPPRIICANLEQQLERGPVIPLWSVVALVYDIIAGASWSMAEGVFNAEATRWYTAAQARGELPFDPRSLR